MEDKIKYCTKCFRFHEPSAQKWIWLNRSEQIGFTLAGYEADYTECPDCLAGKKIDGHHFNFGYFKGGR